MQTFTKEQQYLPLIKAASAQYGVPVELILGHIKQESAFNPNAYRAEPQINDGSTGLMQVLLATAKGIDSSATKEKLYDPAFNISVGTRYIAKNLKRYNGNVQDAIAAYNAGSAFKNAQGRYTSGNGKIDVQGYVDKVYSNMLAYQEWLGTAKKDEVTGEAITGTEDIVEFDWWDLIVPALIVGGVFYWVWSSNKEPNQELIGE